MNDLPVWHDETDRYRRTGRLDQGPCWCPECVEPDLILLATNYPDAPIPPA